LQGCQHIGGGAQPHVPCREFAAGIGGQSVRATASAAH
jgi:hypothetical protein